MKPESTPTTLNNTPYTGLLVSFLPELGEPIAAGTTARVFLVYSEGRFYIIKRVMPQFLGKFREEAGILIRLKGSAASPYVVQYLADIETDKGCFILFPYIHGMTLHKWLAAGHTEEEKASMKEKVQAALAAIHAQGIIHGDVKANNIWVPTDGYPFLYDFGNFGRIGDLTATSKERLTHRVVTSEPLDRITEDLNLRMVDPSFGPPLVQQRAPLDALSARINEIINELNKSGSVVTEETIAAAAAAEAAAKAKKYGFIPSVLASEEQKGGYRKKSRSVAKRPAKTRATKRTHRSRSSHHQK